MHYLLFYDVAADYLERRPQFRAAHLGYAAEAVARGELVLGGALANPADQAILLFRGASAAAAERFAEGDPYVRNGLVTRWYVREWTTVLGSTAEAPVLPNPEALAFALLSVAGATQAGAEHGDAAALAQLQAFYALCSDAISGARGRIIKALGDGMLASFPPEALREAADALRKLQQAGTAQWQAYDPRCRVQVRLGLGTVLAGTFGPPGRESYDIYGNALSQLFKMPPGDFVLSTSAAQRLGA